ncbi:MAG TPA: thiamine phosphate synthase [Rudaea sp.]|jgi:thiamine-phosphate pyrophosphorylase|nr:thiamine phosphate synthase [Rudaea sp.]
MHRSTKLPAHGVYAITNGPRATLIDDVEQALGGGVVIVQYRDKTNDHARRRAEASELRDICYRRDVPLLINDDVDLAAEIGANGVHLGEDDVDIAHARAKLGSGAIIGVSCYDSIERARDSAARGADYLAFGSFFASPTKPNARHATPALLAAARTLDLPLVAIGGITPDNAPALVNAGADFIAVVSGIFSASDIRQAAQRYAALFSK